jgi:hypothetical protein
MLALCRIYFPNRVKFDIIDLNTILMIFTVVPYIWDIIKDFYLPTDAQESCFKKNIKISIETAPTWLVGLNQKG